MAGVLSRAIQLVASAAEHSSAGTQAERGAKVRLEETLTDFGTIWGEPIECAGVP
jgi:hypothetical protein